MCRGYFKYTTLRKVMLNSKFNLQFKKVMFCCGLCMGMLPKFFTLNNFLLYTWIHSSEAAGFQQFFFQIENNQVSMLNNCLIKVVPRKKGAEPRKKILPVNPSIQIFSHSSSILSPIPSYHPTPPPHASCTIEIRTHLCVKRSSLLKTTFDW